VRDFDSTADRSEATSPARGARRQLARDLERLPALNAYLRRMESYPAISAEDQQRLAVDVFETVKKHARLTERGREVSSAEQRRLERSKETLVASTFRLVLLICRERAEERLGRERALERLPELVAEANVAVSEAINTYDPALSPAFSTFVARKVRDRIIANLNTTSDLRLPPSWLRTKRIAAVRIPELTSRLGRVPTREEIQEDLLEACQRWAEERLTDAERDLPAAQRQARIEAHLRKQGMLSAIRQIDDVLLATQSVTSLESPLGPSGDGATLGDLLAEKPTNDSAFDQVELGELREDILAALDTLSERERRILMCRYGFIDNEVWTYPRIAEEFGVTAERIRQIERSVLERLASPHGEYTQLAEHLDRQFE
jgi:RNA polymerase primary sigma factor